MKLIPNCRAILVALGFASLIAAPARAQDPALFTVGGGIYDVFDQNKEGLGWIEYRSDYQLWVFRPFAGLMGTTDKAFYAYGGLGIDFFLGDRFVLTPTIAAGAYFDGDGKDLGHVIEFRSGAELAYRFDNRSRLGVAIYHISNANIGNRNPGVELLTVNYSVPIGSLFGK